MLIAIPRFGYDQGVMGGLLTLPSFIAVFPQIDTTNAAGNSPRAVNQGVSIGSYSMLCYAPNRILARSHILSRLGMFRWSYHLYLARRDAGQKTSMLDQGALGCKLVLICTSQTIFVGSAIMVVGAAIQASSFSLGQLIAGRVITGLGNGLNTSTVPVWQSETSKSHKRGQMVMIEGALITGGIMLSYWIDYGMSVYPSSISWRFPIAFQIVFALIILVFILGLPESPRWLILKGKEDEAIEVMAALSDLPADDEYVQNEFAAIKDTVLEMADVTFAEIFTMGKDRNFHRAALGYVNQMFQQISGINLITYYGKSLQFPLTFCGSGSSMECCTAAVKTIPGFVLCLHLTTNRGTGLMKLTRHCSGHNLRAEYSSFGRSVKTSRSLERNGVLLGFLDCSLHR
nr:sugar transporter stl1 [Quercus suber]